MRLFYVDESGDVGPVEKPGASTCFCLGCVYVDDFDWPSAFDRVLQTRRSIRDLYGIRMSTELKANVLIRNSGALRSLDLDPSDRREVYRMLLAGMDHQQLRAFGVVIDKRSPAFAGADVLGVAWQTLLNRMERSSSADGQTFTVVHDHGADDAIRKFVRKARRYLTAGKHFGGGSFTFKADKLVEDPSPRDSSASYFIQLADLVAYAAWRTYVPPSAAVARVVPRDMWDSAGHAIERRANQVVNQGVPGVVVRLK